MKNIVNYLCGVICALVLCAGAALPQASSSLAELRGTVTDVNGAAIPNAIVTLTDANRGNARTATTTEDGEYVFLGLQPSDYDLKVEAAAGSNFTGNTQRITLTIGQQATIPIQLTAGGVKADVEIVAGSEVVEIGRTQQSNVINEREIIDLPVSRRNFLDLALLTPGVTDSDNINDASDARVAQGRASGLSFGGNNGRGNLVTVDGGPVITTTGGVFETVSQEAVQEFQVLRNSYSAEFGPSQGGIVNTVTKSGTNRISGSAFGLFRSDKLDARNAFDFNADGQSPFNRQQFGGSFGAPLKRDKTFFFTAAERFNQNQTTFVNLLNGTNFGVTDSQNRLFTFLQPSPFGTLATGLRSTLTTTAALYPRTVNLFNSSSGQFPFDANQTYFSARVDHNFSDKTTGFVRVSANDLLEQNQAAGALTAVSRGRSLNQFNTGVLLGLNSQIDATTVNEFKADFFYYKSRLTPNDPFGPEINIRGFGNFGRDIFLPSIGIQRNFDFIDNVTKVVGNHTVKFGGNLFLVNQLDTNETFFGGRFNFEPVIPLVNLIAGNPQAGVAAVNQLNTYLFNAGRADFCPNGFTPITSPTQNIVESSCAALQQPVNALQAFNLNLPAVYQQGFGTTTIRGLNVRAGVFLQDTWRVTNNFTLNYGLRYSQNREPFGLHRDKNDFQPRAAFSWDVSNNGKTVIRGGGGIFAAYVNRLVSGVIRTLGNPAFSDDNINIVLATANSNQLPLNPANPTGPRAPTSFQIYQRLLAVTNNFQRTATAADLAAFGIVPSENGTLEVRFLADPEYKTPESYQASFAIEQDLGAGFSFEAAYLYNRGIFLTRNRDVNPFRASLLTRDGNKPCFNRFPGSAIPATCYNPAVGPTAAVQPPLATTDYRNPFRFQDNLYESSANSFYHGATFTIRRRFARNISVLSHYTFSKTIDEVTDFNSDFSAQNPLNLRDDRALSAFDQRHRVVVSGVFQTPKIGEGAASDFFKDFVFAPIFTYGSGRPFNLLTGLDTNNDGRSLTDRPFGLGRNTGIGESLITFDARLSRRFQLAERRNLELIFEGFNLFNRTNFIGINNEVGNLVVGSNGQTSNGLTREQVNFILNNRARAVRTASPTAPLGFTAAAPARQFQFGARFNF